MDKVWQNLPALLTFILGVISVFFGTRWVANRQSKDGLRKIQMEGDSKAEELYVTHVEKTLDRYEKEMERMKTDFNQKLDDQKVSFDRQIKGLKEEFEREREKERTFYEAEIEKREDRIEELEVVVTEKEKIIIELKKER